MYFVHPQIKLNTENAKRLFYSFGNSENRESLNRTEKMFPGKKLVFTDMGRTAFKLIVEALSLRDSHMVFPAYICDIFFPILEKYNISPIFTDIDLKTFSIDLKQIPSKITSETKAILVCHTYGLPSDIKKIREITNNKLLIIEDCAHAFGAKSDKTYVGNSGDAALFSLYKQFPSLRGGMAVFPENRGNALSEPSETHFNPRDFLSLLNNFEFFAYLFKSFGRDIAPRLQRREKSAAISGINDVSLNIFFNFSQNFKCCFERRRTLALFFKEELEKLGFQVQSAENNIFCYFSALVPKKLNRDEFVVNLRKYGVFCTRIWKEPIILNPFVQKKYSLNVKDFPNTLEAANRIVNFPLQNYYEKKDILKIVKIVKDIISLN